MEPTARELKLIIDAHEVRDNERFKNGNEKLREALDDVSTAIQLTSREIMAEVKHLQEEITKISSEMAQVSRSVASLQNESAGRNGSMKVITYLGIFTASCLMGFLGWVGANVLTLKTNVERINSTLQAYEIEVVP